MGDSVTESSDTTRSTAMVSRSITTITVFYGNNIELIRPNRNIDHGDSSRQPASVQYFLDVGDPETETPLIRAQVESDFSDLELLHLALLMPLAVCGLNR
jgi:hypothetical protein